MDDAVALVQAYLQINGYFTVIEHHPVETVGPGKSRKAFDLNVLAFRLPGAGRLVPGECGEKNLYPPDSLLRCCPDRAEMLIIEVNKEPTELSRGADNPAMLRAILARFGCCQMRDAGQLAHQLLRKGCVISPSGHCVRLVAFGSRSESGEGQRREVISLGHVTQFLHGCLGQHKALSDGLEQHQGGAPQ